MISARSSAVAKHRFLAFLYLTTCFTFTLSPSIAASPEIPLNSELTKFENTSPDKSSRSFVRGQPELQQAMDNMLAREQMIKRNIQFPPGDIEGYPALLTHKTSHLLSEAEHMLNRVKNLRERRWVEAFIHRLKNMVAVLERSVSRDPSEETKGLNYTIKRNAQSYDNMLSPETVQGTSAAVPASTVLGLSHGQKTVKMTSKQPVTSSQLNQVLPMSYSKTEGQVVTKPGLMQQLRNKKRDEDDVLVRELEELRNTAAADEQPQNATSPIESPAELASPVPTKRMSLDLDHDISSKDENEKLKEIIIQEIEALQRLGSTPEEIMNTLRSHAGKSTDAKDVDTKFYQKLKTIEKENNYFKPDLDTLKDVDYGAKDVNAEETMISRANNHVWRPSTLVQPETHPSKEMYMNHSFQGMHLNLPSMNQQVLARQLKQGLLKNPTHETLQFPPNDGIKNTIKKLQNQHQNFLLKNQMLEDPQTPQDDQRGSAVAGPMKQNQFLNYDRKYIVNPSPDLYRTGLENRANYSPYPYSSNTGNKNSTPHGSPFFQTHNIDNNLSDEMKRQLRDGKVILLSDSVVRSNFEPIVEKDKDEKSKEAPNQTVGSEKKKDKENAVQIQK